MSRLDGRWAAVRCDGLGRPATFVPSGSRTEVAVLDWASHHREWIGLLDGESQRDVWLISTNKGTCELHRLSRPQSDDDDDGGEWVLFRWED